VAQGKARSGTSNLFGKFNGAMLVCAGQDHGERFAVEARRDPSS
jgi:hypothetical protein